MKKMIIAFIVATITVVCVVTFSGCSVDGIDSTVGGWFESIKNTVSGWVNSWFGGNVKDIIFDKDSIIFP